MAGIGFQLKKSLSDETYTGLVKGYFFASVIAAGPWIFSIISLNTLSLFLRKYFSQEAFVLFNTMITYSFCFSLIFFGLMDHVITRYLSDKLYFQEKRQITASFSMIWIFLLVFFSAIALPFYFLCKIDFFYKMMGILLFLNLGSIWLSMLFLNAAKNYVRLVVAFLIGTTLSFILGWYFGILWDLKGVLFGYVCGQMTILFILLYAVYAEFSYRSFFSLEWLGYFKKFPLLILAGFFLNLSLWMDKIIFWFSKEDGKQVASLLYNDIHYGSTLFLSYLTMIPALTVFLVRIETSFYVYYRKFFLAIDTKKGLKEILKRKEGLVSSLKESIAPLLKIQLFITGCAIIFASKIVELFQFPTTATAIFRISVLAVFLQAMVIIMGILLLYLLEYKKVILVYFIFCISNFGLTKLSLVLGFPFWGFGLMSSALIAFILMYYFLDKQIGDLEFKTFFGQPLVQPRMYKTQAWDPTETLVTPKELLEEEKTL